MPAPDEASKSNASGGSGTIPPRSKRRVTVLMAGDPTKPNAPAKAVEISESPRPCARPAIQPPTTATEIMRVALQSLTQKTLDRTTAISMLHDAATMLVASSAESTAPLSSSSIRGARSESTVLGLDGTYSPVLQQELEEGSLLPRGQTAAPPPLRLPPDDDASLHSLEGDEDSDYSDRESDPSANPSYRFPVDAGDARPTPPVFSNSGVDNQRVTTIQSVEVGRALPEVHAARQAAYAWMSAAAHGLESCDGSSDAASRRMSVSAAERAFAAYPCSKTASLLSWCLVQYSLICDDVALAKALEQRAVGVLYDPLLALQSGESEGTLRERVQLLEVLCWVQGLAGDLAAAGAAATELLELVPAVSPEIRCILALAQSASGDLESAEATLLTSLQMSPNHVPTHALLAVMWHVMCSSEPEMFESDTSGKGPVDAALEAMSRYVREAEGLVRGTNRASNGQSPVAGFATVRNTWSSASSLAKRAVEAHILAADVCCRVGRVLLADAHITSALECMLDFFSDETATLVSCASKALPQQAHVALLSGKLQQDSPKRGGTAGSSSAEYKLESARVATRVRDLLHQAASLSPTSAPAQLLAVVAEDQRVEGSAWAQLATVRSCTQTSRASLLQLAASRWDGTTDHNRSDALELLFGSALDELQGPLIPVAVLLPWFSAC